MSDANLGTLVCLAIFSPLLINWFPSNHLFLQHPTSRARETIRGIYITLEAVGASFHSLITNAIVAIFYPNFWRNMPEGKKDKKISEVAKREEEILDFWLKNKIFEKSEEKGAPNGDFVFYDGPPFANGLPHYGHLLAGTIKDAIPRYKTMQGYSVRRKWGWDCHGLPVENLIEKQLKLKSKKDIEEIGVDVFNAAAQKDVLKYADEWRKIVPRMGRFVDMDDDYRTMDANYTESVWWVFSELNKKGLVTEGFKSMHLCPRCGTTLSNFEVAQGYADIKDFSVTVKLKLVEEKNTFLLAWTTTPWTLPGNMAAAVNKDEDYVSAELEDGSIVILGKERVENVLIKKDVPHQIVREFKGKELVGKSYKPPFPYYEKKAFDNKENAWKVWHADYVSQEDGTGLVHIAPAFGAEDMDLASEHCIPLMHHVGLDGRFTDDVTDFKGLLVKPKDNKEKGVDHTDTDVEIIKKLAHNGILFQKEKIEHSYPHCWRCNTPLLNYATSSWFVTVPDIKEKLIAANQTVNWIPHDIKDGRFGKWLEGVRDWAVSRARYWGAPLPVWKHPKTGECTFISSVEDLKSLTAKSGNTYNIMRHGESVLNTKETLNAEFDIENGLTPEGKKQVEKVIKELKNKNIDLIFHSPLQRVRETAEMIREGLGLKSNQMTMEGRLKEISVGEFEGKKVSEYLAQYKTGVDRLTITPKGGENWTDVKRRVSEFMYEIEDVHKDKNILIISHNGVMQMLQAGALGLDDRSAGKHIEEDTLDLVNAEVREINFVKLPHNEKYELDLHRPYIDEIELEKDGVILKRIPDVFDCWFESGAMPYAQMHYPFENKDIFDPTKNVGFPADFIAEGLDQTRGWFYSSLVLSVALFGKSPYKNVIVNGLALAEDGKKMSKSLQNYPDPMNVADIYGVDALRLYLLSSPIVRAEDLNFSEKGVQEVMRKNIGRLSNVLSFYELYKDEVTHEVNDDSENMLDQWILARLHEMNTTITKGMEQYELDRATRPISGFIDDLSTWYVRRSRDRYKGDDQNDKALALGTTKYVLIETAKLIAPFMPFYADYLYKSLEDNKESVHLESWPKGKKVDKKILEEMKDIREIVSLGLEQRDVIGVKVRQPLQTISFEEKDFTDKEAAHAIIMDEINVKGVLHTISHAGTVVLNETLTPELIQEGNYRDLLRHVQALRKKEKLQPSDMVLLKVGTDKAGKELIDEFENELKKIAGLKDIVFEDGGGETLSVGESKFTLNIVK